MPLPPANPADHPLSTVWLQCFGAPSLSGRTPDHTDPVLLPAGKPLLVLAVLAARYPAPVTRDELALLGWGHRDELHAKASLRQALYRIRHMLGSDVIASDDRSARLTVAIPGDWAVLCAAVSAGDDAALLSDCRGVFLHGIESGDHNDPGDWVSAERMRWTLLVREAALREGRRALTAGDIDRAVALGERALASRDERLAGWELYLEALRAIESPSRLEGGVARLESAGEHGQLDVADPTSWQQLARRFRRAIRKQAPVAPGEVLSTSGILPFTGRDILLDHLRTLLTQPTNGHPNTIAMIAGPGFGKSRMLRELRPALMASGAIVAQVEAISPEIATPWALLNRIVETLAELPEALGIDPLAASQLVALNPQLRERFRGAAVAEQVVPTLDDLALALAELMGTVGEARPLVLIVDDLHWADERSVAALGAALLHPAAGAVRCLAASRDDASPLLRECHTLYLPSLSVEAIEALLASSIPAITAPLRPAAAETLLMITGGVPHYVARALHRLTELDAAAGTATTDHGAELLAAIPNLKLYHDPAFPTAANERSILGYLAVAGGTISVDELRAAVGVNGLEPSLQALKQQGWILLGDAGARLSHDLVQRQVLEGLPAGPRRTLSFQRAHWLMERGSSLHDLQNSVRIYLAHSAPSHAVAAVRRWCGRVQGGARGSALAELILPPDADRLLRWQVTAAATPALLVRLALVGIVLSLTVWGGVAWLGQATALRSENAPRVQPTEPGLTIVRNMEPPLFTIRDRLGRISTRLDGESLRVVGRSSSVDSLYLHPLPVVRQGRVSADSLAVFTHMNDSLQLTFQVGDLPPHPLTVFRGYADQSLAIVGGQFNGKVLDSIRPEVTVNPGDSLTGSVIFVYTTPAQAALWIMAQSSTMTTLATDTASVMTMHTGAARAIGEVRIARRAPLTPGRYWMVWTFAAEPSAVWILSLTNWRCGTPHWNDQNDLLAVPDSMLAQAWGSGWLTAKREICDDPKQVIYHQTRYPAATMRITVRPR